MTLSRRWIICTKWEVKIPKMGTPPPMPEMKDGSPVGPTVKEPEYETKAFWTPVGTPAVFGSKSMTGIPVEFATADEAIAGLQKLVDESPELTEQNLKFCILEVKYVPRKIKAYKQDWFDKYVTNNQNIELAEHKFIDKMQ